MVIFVKFGSREILLTFVDAFKFWLKRGHKRTRSECVLTFMGEFSTLFYMYIEGVNV
jgi:hypothetical protein